jgi:hypothetical protein
MTIYTVNNSVHQKATEYLNQELGTREELDMVLGKEPLLVLGDNGYYHHETLNLLKQLTSDFSLLFFDAHSDRYFIPGQDPRFDNFGVFASQLEHLMETIYLGLDGRAVCNPKDLLGFLSQCKVYSSKIFASELNATSLLDFQGYPDNPQIRAMHFSYEGERYPEPVLEENLRRLLEINPTILKHHILSHPSWVLSLEWARLPSFNPSSILSSDVYVTTDVDVLEKEEGVPIVDFSRGDLTISDYLLHLQSIADHKRILVLDIMGLDWKKVNQNDNSKKLILAAHEIIKSQ